MPDIPGGSFFRFLIISKVTQKFQERHITRLCRPSRSVLMFSVSPYVLCSFIRYFWGVFSSLAALVLCFVIPSLSLPTHHDGIMPLGTLVYNLMLLKVSLWPKELCHYQSWYLKHIYSVIPRRLYSVLCTPYRVYNNSESIACRVCNTVFSVIRQLETLLQFLGIKTVTNSQRMNTLIVVEKIVVRDSLKSLVNQDGQLASSIDHSVIMAALVLVNKRNE